MERATWTYELPPGGWGDVGLEHYQVASPAGHVGIVAAVLDRGGDLFLAAAPSGFPVTRRLVVVPWHAVDEVDHSALTVRVRSMEGALELDPGRAVENGEADARRVTELPPELRGLMPPGDVAGPRDRLPIVAAIACAALGFVTLLGALVIVSEAESAWRLAAVAVPALLLALAGAFALAAWRRPYAAAAGRDRPVRG